jgi:hypothetical protein
MAGKKVQVKVPMSEMLNVSVEWVSLVDRPANRIPFRVVKSEDGEEFIYSEDHVELADTVLAEGRNVNGRAVGILRAAVNSGRVNSSAPWKFSAADGNRLLGPDKDNFSRFATVHLATNTGAEPDTKARWSFPVAKMVAGRIVVFRSGVRAAIARAGQTNDAGVQAAARGLLNLIDKKRQ